MTTINESYTLTNKRPRIIKRNTLVLKEYSKPRPQSTNKLDPRDISSKLIGFLGRYSVSFKGTTILKQKFLDE